MESVDSVSIDPNERLYTSMDSQSNELVPVTSAEEDDQREDQETTEKGHLAIPEIIETLKNLAACKEKLFKWEQSVSSLESIPDSDPNKSHLMEIIDFVENTNSSTKEKAIYLYEQLGVKCRQHKNYIGAAKAFERAASLRLDISDLNETGDNREDIVTSTIRYLESAIDNYDAIHKFKHAGTLHYRCSKILRMMNASHEEVDKHHEKALEYFTKPHHELKHRKRIDGLKISCYSSYSTLAKMHHEIEKFTHTTTTTTTNTIKFHSDSFHSEDSDSNHSTTPPPSSSGSANGPLTPAIQFYGEDRNHEYHTSNDHIFDSFMEDGFFDQQTSRPVTNNDDVHATESASAPTQGSTRDSSQLATTANVLQPIGNNKSNERLERAQLGKPAGVSNRGGLQHNSSSSHHSFAHHESVAAVKDHHHLYHHHLAKSHSASSGHSRHLQSGPNGASSALSSYSFAKSQHKSSSSSSLASAGLPHSSSSLSSSLTAALHASHHLHKNTFRCIEDRIESARKLVKKLSKLCPFYEVSTNGDDAGRVYCRICDRYLGAVSSTLKNHVNTQEHRQAYEDSQQLSSGTQGTGTSFPNAANSNSASKGTTAVLAASTTSSVSTLNPSYTSTGNPRSEGPNYTASGQSAKENYCNPNEASSLVLQPAMTMSPFMLQTNSLPYQPTLQTLDSALQKSHLSGKYMDFDLGPNIDSGMLNSSSWQQNAPNQTQPQITAGPGTAEIRQVSLQQQQQQQYLFGNHPHYAIPSSSTQLSSNSANGTPGNAPVLTYQ